MKKNTLKQTVLIAFLLLSTIANAQWTQIGNDIDGEAAEDNSGMSVSLSADGSVVAIGAHFNDGNGMLAGHVRIYRDSSGTWTQIGSDIDGEAVADYSGSSVCLSADGSIVAIGATGNDGTASFAGHVRIYENKSGTWTQIGSDIDGEAANDNSGGSVSLSDDGTIVAIGGASDDNGSNTGHVRVYQNISGTWTQLGNDIDGEGSSDFSGHAVSVSGDGSVVAIGAPTNDGNGSNSGHVRIYENIAGTWTQIGNDIDGEAATDISGWSVNLSANGLVVAIGARWNDGNGTEAGHVRIYKNMGGTWTQIGSDIDGEAAGDESGWSVSLSTDGSIVAIGAPNNDGNGTNAGHVRIYTNPSVGVNEISTSVEVSVYPNPTKGKITIECEGMEKVEVVDITGKLVYELSVSSDVLNINISAFSKGVYFVKVSSENGVGVQQIVLE